MYIITLNNITVILDNQPITVPSSHPKFAEIKAAVLAGEDPSPFLSVPRIYAEFTEGRVKVDGRSVTFNGEPIHAGLATKIADFVAAQQPELAEPLCRFLDRLSLNPSFRAQRELFDWIETSGMPIAADGRIIGWKIVNDNYMDCYSGKFDNSVGKTVEVKRFEVDDDRDQTCSYGLHFCSPAYLPHYGPSNKRVVMVAIDPADVIAFPRDFHTSKGRCCKYEVICEVPAAQAATYFTATDYVYDFEAHDEDKPVEEDDGERITDLVLSIDENYLEVETNQDTFQVYLDATCFGDTSDWSVAEWRSADVSFDELSIVVTVDGWELYFSLDTLKANRGN